MWCRRRKEGDRRLGDELLSLVVDDEEDARIATVSPRTAQTLTVAYGADTALRNTCVHLPLPAPSLTAPSPPPPRPSCGP